MSGLVVDHVAHFVPDLDAAAQALEALGFIVTPRSEQRTRAADGTLVPAGAANRCVMLEDGYVEVLTPGAHATPIAAQLRAAIAARVGVHLLALGTAAIERDRDRLAAAGFDPQPPVALERTIDAEAGSATARFTVLRVPPGTMAEGRIQFVHHHTPELLWQQRWLRHANGARSLAAVLIVAADPAAAAARYAAFTGLAAASAMATTRGALEFLAPEEFRERFGLAPPPPPAIAGYALACDDPAAIVVRARAIGWRVHEVAGAIAFAAPPALGGIVVLDAPRRSLDAPRRILYEAQQHDSGGRMTDDRPAVVGSELLAAKHSAVDSRGDWRVEPIAGVLFRPTRPVPHEDGHVIEIARQGWPVLEHPIVQVHLTTTLPGRVRAWGLHRRSTDRLFVAGGLVKIACYDGREGSPTFGRLNEFTLSDRNPGLVVVPPCVYHGWKNIGTAEAIVINMPTSRYEYDAPDALDLPWDSDAARAVIPYRW